MPLWDEIIERIRAPTEKNLRIIFGTDEESGMSDVPHYLAAEQPPVFGFTPDCKYPVVYGERGVVNVALHFPLPDDELQQLTSFQGINSETMFLTT